MKLDLSYRELSTLFDSEISVSGKIHSIAYDSRKIIEGSQTLFFAFPGDFRDGHDFIPEAYAKGVRLFIVNKAPNFPLPQAIFIIVQNTLEALQDLAKYHRSKHSCTVIGITGSAGKTTVKEILGSILQEKFNVIRSPKSYNSQLGVAISLLEITPETEVAIIEAGISQPGEMEKLEKMILPDIGIFTSFGSAHARNFKNSDEHLSEKLMLFKHCKTVYVSEHIDITSLDSFKKIKTDQYSSVYGNTDLSLVYQQNCALAIACAQDLGVDMDLIKKAIHEIRPIAMRMEVFEGVHNTLIINDTYNLDREGLEASLQYQKLIAGDKKRILYVGTSSEINRKMVSDFIEEFEPIDVYFRDETDLLELEISNSVILIKGDRNSKMEQVSSTLRQFKHETYVEIDLTSIRDNIQALKAELPKDIKVLAMVKAQSYGSGGERLATYLERIGINYLGVAYPDEGAELRASGVSIPIMVMNADPASMRYCIDNELEPTIYSTEQLDTFIRELIYKEKFAYPIHIKLETGMNRLGFREGDIRNLIDILKSQPEVKVQSVYSHLAASDDPKSSYTNIQVDRLNHLCSLLEQAIPYHFDKHILNSEGIINFPEYHMDMVRIGIAMYGVTNDPKMKSLLQPSLKWYSTVSQIRHLKKGETVGYSQKGVMEKDGMIAVIPVGYADGFRRMLGNGNGGVYINDKFCRTIGNVCMDMIMVDVTGSNVKAGDQVEIIGLHQPLELLAYKMETIPYEVMTSISKRVHRVYLEK